MEAFQEISVEDITLDPLGFAIVNILDSVKGSKLDTIFRHTGFFHFL